MILDYYLLLSVVVNCVYDNVEHDVVSLGWSFLSSLMNDIGVLLYLSILLGLRYSLLVSDMNTCPFRLFMK